MWRGHAHPGGVPRVGDSTAAHSHVGPARRGSGGPAPLTQYPPQSALVLLGKSLEGVPGPSGLSTGKAEEVGAGGRAGVPGGQGVGQETPAHRRVAGACGRSARLQRRGEGAPQGPGRATPGAEDRDPQEEGEGTGLAGVWGRVGEEARGRGQSGGQGEW